MAKIKTYVLMISKTYPKYHPKAGQPTGFVGKILRGEKIHTIRTNHDLWRMRIEEVNKGNAIISLRFWEDKPYRSKQIEFKRLTYENNIAGEDVFITYNGWLGYEVSVEYEELFGCIQRDSVSINDGLDVWDFSDWFFINRHPKEFSGIIIHFTKFRYDNSRFY